jgi:quercetin dioxygenase-like cupin family protein
MTFPQIAALLPHAGVQAKKVAQAGHFAVTLVCLAKGERLDPHTSPTDAFIYVLEGDANFNLEGHAHFIQAGDGLAFKAQAVHSVNALTDFKMLLVR